MGVVMGVGMKGTDDEIEIVGGTIETGTMTGMTGVSTEIEAEIGIEGSTAATETGIGTRTGRIGTGSVHATSRIGILRREGEEDIDWSLR